jgi:hypothetical protein
MQCVPLPRKLYKRTTRRHGIEKGFPTVKSVLPIRKKKNTLLSNDDIRYNKNHSRLRIVVEHTICKIKKFGIK